MRTILTLLFLSAAQACPLSRFDAYFCGCRETGNVQRISCRTPAPLKLQEDSEYLHHNNLVDIEVEKSKHVALEANALNGITRRFITFRSNADFETIKSAAFNGTSAYALAFNGNRKLSRIYNNAFYGWTAPPFDEKCSQSYHGLECEMSLAFSDNGPLKFKRHTFMSLSNLTALYLASMTTPIHIKRYTFSLMVSLRKLELSGRIHGIQYGVFMTKGDNTLGGLALEKLILRENFGYRPKGSHFAGLEKLKSLSLLRVDMRLVQHDVFNRLKQLEALTIVECGMKTLPQGVVRLQRLKTLDLRGNKLKSFPALLFSLPSVETVSLVMQQHPLPCDCGMADITSWKPFQRHGYGMIHIGPQLMVGHRRVGLEECVDELTKNCFAMNRRDLGYLESTASGVCASAVIPLIMLFL